MKNQNLKISKSSSLDTFETLWNVENETQFFYPHKKEPVESPSDLTIDTNWNELVGESSNIDFCPLNFEDFFGEDYESFLDLEGTRMDLLSSTDGSPSWSPEETQNEELPPLPFCCIPQPLIAGVDTKSLEQSKNTVQNDCTICPAKIFSFIHEDFAKKDEIIISTEQKQQEEEKEEKLINTQEEKNSDFTSIDEVIEESNILPPRKEDSIENKWKTLVQGIDTQPMQSAKWWWYLQSQKRGSNNVIPNNISKKRKNNSSRSNTTEKAYPQKIQKTRQDQSYVHPQVPKKALERDPTGTGKKLPPRSRLGGLIYWINNNQ